MRQIRPVSPKFEKVSVNPGQSFFWKHYRISFPPADSCFYHYHPEYELIHFLEAGGSRIVGDSIGSLCQGELLLLPPRLPHAWLCPPPIQRMEAIFVQFLPACLGEDFFNLPEMRPIKDLLARAHRGLVFSKKATAEVQGLLLAWDRLDGHEKLLRFLQVLAILGRDRESALLCSQKFCARLRHGHEERFSQVYGFLNEHFSVPIRQAEVARLIRMNTSAFSRLFHKTTGKRFVDALNEIRVSQACGRLVETDQTVAEIAYACGYQTLSHFNRQFRRVKQRSPREFRRAFQKMIHP